MTYRAISVKKSILVGFSSLFLLFSCQEVKESDNETASSNSEQKTPSNPKNPKNPKTPSNPKNPETPGDKVLTNKEREDHQLSAGFKNLRNTCFANAATTLLFEIPDISDRISGELTQRIGEPENEFESRKKLRRSTNALFEKRQDPKNDTSSLTSLVDKYFDRIGEINALTSPTNSPNVGGSDGALLRRDQGDSADFINELMGYLDFPVSGWMQKMTFDNGLTQTSDVNGKIVNLSLASTLSTPEQDRSMQDILDIATSKEDYVGENMRMAPDGILRPGQALRAFDSQPKWAIFNLTRFTYNADSNSSSKVFSIVNPSKKLVIPYFADLFQQEPDASMELELKAITVHSGSTLSGGHYYAYVHNKNLNKWVKFNDSSVSFVSEETVMKDSKKNGYQFLYVNPNP